MAILIIEDEKKVSSFLKRTPKDFNNRIATASSGIKGLDLLIKNDYQLIILDIRLPDLNAIEICKKIRETNSTPILLLTPMGIGHANITEPDAEQDYSLHNPSQSKELPPGIESCPRYPAKEDIEFNNDTNLSRTGTIIDLTTSEYRLLEYLLKNKGKVLSRADIAENVWTVSFDTGPNIIQVYFNYLRKKIDKTFTPKLIHTLLGWDMF